MKKEDWLHQSHEKTCRRCLQGRTPCPPPVGSCLNPGLLWGARPQCWLTETILPSTISSISQWRVPNQCSSLLLCCDLCHLPIYRPVSGQFLSWKASLCLFHPPPLSLSVLLCLLLLQTSCGKITALTQCGHNSQDWLSPPVYDLSKPISAKSLSTSSKI